MRTIYLAILCLYGWSLSAQNAGIGTATPSEKLEVAGTIYTNQGGIKFPDETVQTTAAFNAPPPTESMKHAAGFAKFFKASLDGPLDTLGKTKMSLLYNVNYPMIKTGTSQLQVGPIFIIKETDKGTPGFFSSVVTQAQVNSIEIYLTRLNASGDPEIYMTIYLSNTIVSEITTQMSKAYYGYYANEDVITLHPQKVAIKDVGSGNCYCYDLVLNQTCTCP